MTRGLPEQQPYQENIDKDKLPQLLKDNPKLLRILNTNTDFREHLKSKEKIDIKAETIKDLRKLKENFPQISLTDGVKDFYINKVHYTRKDVIELQKTLKQNGFRIDVDGKFGNQTFLAIATFQQKRGLTVDGKAGDNTLNALGLGTVNTFYESRKYEAKMKAKGYEIKYEKQSDGSFKGKLYKKEKTQEPVYSKPKTSEAPKKVEVSEKVIKTKEINQEPSESTDYKNTYQSQPQTVEEPIDLYAPEISKTYQEAETVEEPTLSNNDLSNQDEEVEATPTVEDSSENIEKDKGSINDLRELFLSGELGGVSYDLGNFKWGYYKKGDELGTYKFIPKEIGKENNGELNLLHKIIKLQKEIRRMPVQPSNYHNEVSISGKVILGNTDIYDGNNYNERKEAQEELQKLINDYNYKNFDEYKELGF